MLTLTNHPNRLQEETAKVEGHLINGSFTKEIISCFTNSKINAFDPNLLEPLLKLLRLSPSLSSMLATSDMFSGIGQKLCHKKAVVRLNLLRLLRNILDAREVDYFSSSRDKCLASLLEDIQTLADKDSAVLVRNLASELVRSHINGEYENAASSGISSLSASSSSAATSASRPRPSSRPSSRRIYTPPSLHSSASTPMTPTHAHRSSQSAFIEVAHSPKRSAVSITHERDPSLYRPRSRDSTGIPVSGIPRRVSGDLSSSVGSKSRLPRNPGVLPRTSVSDLSDLRRNSIFSNKENQATEGGSSSGTRYSFVPESPTLSSSSSSRRNGSVSSTSTSHSRSGSGKQRRSRAPSEGGAKKWNPGA